MAPQLNIPPGPALPPNPPPPGQTKPLPTPSKSGKIAFAVPNTDLESETWYSIYGELTASTIPLICLHGGPGMAYNYLLPISHISTSSAPGGGRPVIMYDQIGCGNSTHFASKSGDEKFWTPSLFISELLNLISALNITTYDLLGQSWGGMLAATFAASSSPEQLKGLRKLVIADSPSDMHTWVAVADLLRKRLPSSVQETLTRLEKEQKTETPEYEQAMMVFYERFVCRVVPFPDELTQTMEQLAKDPTVYHTMNGPSEFHVSGSLKDWCITDKLRNIDVESVLLVNGRFDEAQDVTMEPYFREVGKGTQTKVKWVRFAESSHCPHLEETDAFVEVVGRFLEG
ncbi:hypothetical protein AAFC00_007286 [Neodothiora populina]|uniref:AB hydrolase-1 domain-containing protein n=1 Tax=Neodothiora populina TaxID=2781224 RepID=A0ABR3PHS5_9PEZI